VDAGYAENPVPVPVVAGPTRRGRRGQSRARHVLDRFRDHPDGILAFMINYLTRRRNPTPYINFMPPEVLAYGEANMVRALEAHPPDFMVVVDKDTSEYGVPRFGRDYGRLIATWVTEKKYDVVASFGPRPLTGSGFGVLLIKRR
jgi:hypothetical protein